MLATAVALLAPLASAEGPTLPTRRAGWWDQTTNMNIGGEPHAMTSQFCTDATIEKQYSVLSANLGARNNCTRRDVTPIPGGWHAVSTCGGRGGQQTISATVTGDFQSHVHMDIDMSGAASSHVVMDMRYLGACPPGRRPGDMVMPGGMVMNMAIQPPH
jgi:hypothetical protein